MPQRHWATGADQLLAGPRYLILFADLETPRLSAVKDALATIAAAGRHTRVGLTPQPGARLWCHDPAARLPVHHLPDAVAGESSAAVLQYIRRRQGPRDPLEVHVSQRHIALDIDHGLGDGRLSLELISALFAIAGGHSSAWLTHEQTSLALPRALIRTFGTHPNRVRMAWRYAAGMRSTDARPEATRGSDSVAWSPSFAVAVAHVDPDAESKVDEWRRANAQKAGRAAVWLYIVGRALRAAGLQTSDKVSVAFDCRRYLAKGVTVNGNFMIGLRIPFTDDETLPTMAARMRECTTAALPLAGLGAFSALAVLPTGTGRRTSSTHKFGAVADVTFSDMGHITSLDGLPWHGQSGEDERSYIGLLDPAGPDRITVLNSRIGAARNISISFHDNVFDRCMIDKAADSLTDPMQFLPGNAAPQIR